jgi:hypothetical protein
MQKLTIGAIEPQAFPDLLFRAPPGIVLASQTFTKTKTTRDQMVAGRSCETLATKR